MSKICGIDEVGRGPLAGPVISAASNFAYKSQYKRPGGFKKNFSKEKRDVV